jgi:predicted P-loop ATPase
VNVAEKKITVISGGKPDGKRGKGGGGAYDPNDWRHGLVRDRDGLPKPTLHNLMLILENDPHLSGLFAMNEFENRICLQKIAPWPGAKPNEYRETDATRLSAWLGNPDRYTLNAKPDMVNAAVLATAESAAYHPVRTYLNGLVWDQKERLPSLFMDCFGVTDSAYARHVSVVFAISAVARIFIPGCQVDFMLVLEGGQGAGKTRAVNALFGDDWYAESMESPQHKDFYISLLGRWGVEIGEMHSFSKADTTKVKQAVTARFDHYRPPYGRAAQSFPRQSVFVGTTNEHDWQRDHTGARRYLPIRVGAKVDVGALRELRDQIWAEAVVRFKRGEQWWALPPGAEDQQEDRFQEDSWTEPVDRWLSGACDDKHYTIQMRRVPDSAKLDYVSTSEILNWALGLDYSKHTRAEQNRIGQIMRKLGWESMRKEESGRKRRLWIRPAPF